MRVLVCGSRTYPDEMFVWYVLSGMYRGHDCGWLLTHVTPFIVISGLADGADTYAKTWVENCPLHGPPVGQPNTYEVCPVQLLPFPADWKQYGKAAGPIRNQQMLDEGKPELVLAFVDKPVVESRGTWDMVQRARKAQVLTHVLERM